MENEFKMYSNEVFANILKGLINNTYYSTMEIEKELKNCFGTSISYKQLNKYLKGSAIPKADNLYLLAEFFRIQIDALLGRCDLDGFYFVSDEPNINKFHLDSDSRHKLSSIKNDTEIKVLNEIIDSDLIETFATQLENATAQLKTAQDKETKENITYIASCMLQREIDKLFRKCLTKYMKK